MTSRSISVRTPRRPGRVAYVHFRAMSCRCQRKMVSGVTIVAIGPRPRWPHRCPWTANRRRSSSVKRIRPFKRVRRMRLSSTRSATLACRWSAHQPATATTKSRRAATSTTAGVYISDSMSRPKPARLRSGTRPSWLLPTEVQNPRYVKVGAQVNF